MILTVQITTAIWRSDMSGPSLPAQFSELERFLPEWAPTNEMDLIGKRMSSSVEEKQDFYDAVLPRIEEMLDFLAKYSLDDVPEDVANLIRLGQMFMDAAFPIENYGLPEHPDAFDVDRIEHYSPPGSPWW